MRKLIKLLAALCLLIVVGLVAGFLYIDIVAKKGIEHGGTYALGVNTKLRGANVKVFTGEFAMSGLEVANPSGFKADHFLKLEDGGVQVSLGTLRQDIVNLPNLTLSDVDVNLEKKDGKSNYQVILDNLKRFETEPPPDEQAKRFIINKLAIKDVKVHLDLGAGELGKINVPIDEVVMENVGSDGSGVRLADLAGIIIKAVFKAAVEKGGSLIPGDISGELQAGLAQLQDLSKFADIEKLGEIGGKLGSGLEDITSKGGDLGDKTKEGVEKAKDAIGDLLGGKKDN